MGYKLFKTKRIKSKELRSVIYGHAKSLGVGKVLYNTQSKTVDGTYNAGNKNIFLNAKQNKRSLLITYFHELGHHIACTQGLWTQYHFNIKKLKPETQFLIENNIDKIAKVLWNKYVCNRSWGSYKYTYPLADKKNLIKWLKKYNK